MPVYRCERHGERYLLEKPDCALCKEATVPEAYRFNLKKRAGEVARESLRRLIRVEVVKKD